MKGLDLINKLHADDLKPAIDRYVRWIIASRADGAEVDQCEVELAEALDELGKAAKAAREALRASVHDEMLECGILQFDTLNFSASHVAGAQRATVTDLKKLRAARPDLFKPQPDNLDTAALTKLLKAGIMVDGAELSNGGAGHIQIKARKDQAA
ncbi:siphovirus Gp157 family protein [Gluconacetobacter asukensis]|uniref:Uncharacterized protein n=1 Tax=Gluconacetobacter asukensis TaxID=1017181 RepID=A0A7W4P2G0_9PROT|nr:siphovirus Gp157 family protein [Gluconacetobacter asukensis]MBB2172843.1 hypothetical protein [Gluconacetobacter asukensis]